MLLPRLLKKLISIVLLLPLATSAQDITGLWKGTLYNDTTKETLRFEVGISEEKGKLIGFSHTFIQHEDKLYFAIKKIKLRKKDGKIIIEDLDMIANSSPITPPKGVYKTCVLDLNPDGEFMELSGPFITNRTKEYHPLTGWVKLQRKNDYYQSDLLSRLSELRLANENNFAPLAIWAKAEPPASAIGKKIPIVPTNGQPEPSAATTVVPAVQEPTSPTLPKINGAATTVDPTAPKTMPGVIVKSKTVAVDSFALPVTATELTLGKSNNAATTLSGSKPVTVGQIAGNKAVAVDSFALPVSETELTLAKPNGSATPLVTATPKPSVATIAGSNAVAVSVEKPKAMFEPASSVNERGLETIESVWVQSDSLQLTLYDNGEVDGDTVSVLLNGQVIMPKQGLSTKAVKKTIFLPAGTDSVQLIMYAENLGSIPPNTGLLVVHDGEKVYEIRFSADMKKSAAIVFRRKH